ncbi:HAD hydrolase-like protein [Dactylosporangium roseum]
MREPSIVIWDLDGTAITYRNPKRSRYSIVLSRHFGQLAEFDEAELVGATDAGILELGMRRVVDGADPKDLLPVLLRSLDLEMRRELVAKEAPYEPCAGVDELLDLCAAGNIPNSVVTGNTFYRATEKLTSAGLLNRFDMEWGAYGDEATQRHELVETCLRRAAVRLRADRDRLATVMIGDSPADAQAARRVGIPVVLVATGHYTAEQLADYGADLVLESLTGNGERVLEVLAPQRA